MQLLKKKSATERGFDFAGEMSKVDEEPASWGRSLTSEQQDQVIAMGPPEDHNTGGFLDKNY